MALFFEKFSTKHENDLSSLQLQIENVFESGNQGNFETKNFEPDRLNDRYTILV